MAQPLRITETENTGLKRRFDVVVPAGTLELEVGKQLKQVGQRAKIPGFRPGKIPEKVLRQKYGASVMGDVLQNAVNDATREVLEKQKITPAMQPDVKVTDYKEGGDLAFTMDLEVMPEAPEIGLGRITVEKPVYAASEDEITQALSRIAAGNRSLKAKAAGAKAEKGDVVKIDFKGFLGEEAFPGGEGRDFDLELGSGQFIPGFEEQLLGFAAGEKVTVNVPFPTDYHAPNLAGKDARFEVKIHHVQQSELPEVNDKFAAGLGMGSLEKLKDAIRNQIGKDYDSLARNRMKKELFDQLEKKCDFAVPEGMLKQEFSQIWQQVEEAKQQEDPTIMGKSDEALKKEYEAIALRRVRLGIFLSQTAGKQKLTVDRSDLQRAMLEQARMYPGQEQRIMEFYQKHPEQLAELRGPILEEKAVDYILTQVKLKEVSIPLDTLMAEQQEESAHSGAAHVHDEHCDHDHEAKHVHDEHCQHDHDAPKGQAKAKATKAPTAEPAKAKKAAAKKSAE